MSRYRALLCLSFTALFLMLTASHGSVAPAASQEVRTRCKRPPWQVGEVKQCVEVRGPAGWHMMLFWRFPCGRGQTHLSIGARLECGLEVGLCRSVAQSVGSSLILFLLLIFYYSKQEFMRIKIGNNRGLQTACTAEEGFTVSSEVGAVFTF